MKLLFRAMCAENVVPMMNLFWFIFVQVILGWKIFYQTFVAFSMFYIILICACWFPQKLWNTVLANSNNKRMFDKVLERHSFILVNNKTFSDEIFQILREIFEERDVISDNLNF